VKEIQRNFIKWEVFTMKIAIISDTHGSLTAFNRALEIADPCDFIVHAGDILYHGPRNPLPDGYQPQELANAINALNVPFIAAAGNCDAPIDQALISVPIQAPYALLYIENFKILINHGDKLTLDELTELAIKWKINLLITGHTHEKQLEKNKEIILLNPGSCALPKDGIASMAILEDSNISLVNIDNGKTIKSISVK